LEFKFENYKKTKKYKYLYLLHENVHAKFINFDNNFVNEIHEGFGKI